MINYSRIIYSKVIDIFQSSETSGRIVFLKECPYLHSIQQDTRGFVSPYIDQDYVCIPVKNGVLHF